MRRETPGRAKQRSAVTSAVQTAKIGRLVIQASLPKMGCCDRLIRKKRTRAIGLDAETLRLIAVFRVRLSNRSSAASAAKYGWTMTECVRLACRLAGTRVRALDLFKDSALLGMTLACGWNSRGDREISAWLASQRRGVVRSFALLMAGELLSAGISDGASFVDAALRTVADPVGGGYRLPVGWPRGFGGAVPAGDAVEALSQHLGSAPGWQGARNQALLSLLRLRGQRIGALLGLDGGNLHRLNDGAARMSLHAKSSREPFELAVPASVVSWLDAYVEGFNEATSPPYSIGFGVPGPFWRDALGVNLTPAKWTSTLRDAAAFVGVPIITSHAFRRASATEAVTRVSRSVASLAGNWSSPRRMDEHYVQPSLTRLALQLAKLPATTQPSASQPVETRETVKV
jgi:hypothetical protein